MKKWLKVIILIIIIIAVVVISIIVKNASIQKEIVAKNKNIIYVDQLKFKDLNNNGKLDKYEDWRLDNKQRAEDLISQMTLEEKAGMLVINTQYSAEGQKNEELLSHDGKLNEEKSADDIKIYLNYLGNSETIVNLNIRHVITRENIRTEKMAEWANALNELAESTRLGIPVIITSNSMNHMASPILAEYKGATKTIYPSTLGIAAAALGEEKEKGTTEIIKNFAKIVKNEFMASGIRKGYMYSADVMTDARWARNNETFGENVDFISKTVETMVKTIQGDEGLSKDGVALTIKHFPGSGARKNGLDAHFENGKYSPYITENSLQNYHLKPFQAAIDSKVAAIMPYYSQPDPNSAKQTYQGKEISMTGSSYTYNSEFLNNLLRENMGFEGYINTDSGVIDFISWGEENKSNVEKVAKAINSGVDMISDTNHTEWIVQAVQQGLLTEEKINESLERVLNEMFELGLFENPYVDIEKTQKNVTTEENIKEAYKVHQKSVVLLKNENNALPIKATDTNKKIKVYVKEYQTTGRLIADALYSREYNIEQVEDYKEADYLITYISGRPENAVNNLNLKETIGDDYDNWINIGNTIKEKGGKRITIINFQTAYILKGIEEYSDSMLGTFDTYTCAIMDVITGKCKATGVLPFTIPASEEVVAIDEQGNCASPNDVPGYDKSKYMKNNLTYEYVDSLGNKYICGFGL